MMISAHGVKRIIPALAGNTGSTSTTPTTLWDHPRSRGEYREIHGPAVASSGSSPLSRGIQTEEMFIQRYRRIIPALAGNTICRSEYGHL